MTDIVHFHNCTGGGMLSVIKNLLEFSENPLIRNHVIFTNNVLSQADYKIPVMKGASSVQLFKYSPHWNFYYTCRQLKKLLPNKAVVVAHDWLELGMVSNLGLQNRVVQFIHGDYGYYYDLAFKHSEIVDLYITVSNSIYEKLIVLLSDKIDSIKYLRFPVPDFTPLYKVDTIFNISFVGRKTIEKGYNILPLLAEKLASNNENICWHIFGSATNNQFDCFWNPEINVKHYGEVSQQFILSMLPKMDLLLLPSKAEGMPLSVIEGMKAGVVPIVANIDGGIQEIVIENITGYKIDNNHLDNYVEKILYLYKNEERLKSLKLNCIELANKNFNPLLNTLLIEDEILNLKSKNKLAVKVYGSRLDRKNLPNFITRFFRNFQQCKKLW